MSISRRHSPRRGPRIPTPWAAAGLLLFATLGCSGEEGALSIDVCVHAEAAGLFADAHSLRIVSRGDVEDSVVVPLGSMTNVHSDLATYPIGARLAFEVEVLDGGNVALARGEHGSVTVREVTPLCVPVCGMSEDERQACRSLLCEVRADKCTFMRPAN